MWLDIDGERVARPADAQSCLDFLDDRERLVNEHGHYAPETRDEHIGDVVAVLDPARSVLPCDRRLTSARSAT